MPVLVTLCSSSWAPMAKQLFASARIHGKWKWDLMLLTEAETDERPFMEKGIIVKKFPVLGGFHQGYLRNNITFHKSFLLREELKQWDTIVYYDADVIIKAPIFELARVSSFSACRCMASTNLGTHFEKNIKLQHLKNEYLIDLEKKAFNAGFFAFPSKVLTPEMFPNFMGLINKYHRIFTLEDQSAMNVMFYDQWTELPEIYNKLSGRLEEPGECVRHFYARGATKPWDPKSQYHQEWLLNLSAFDML
jgi:lipopolysaccharide biosynthesis glycosyltransferase